MQSANITAGSFRTAFVLILVLGISLLFLAVIWPFFQTLLLAALLSGLCHPLFRFMTKILGGRRSLASGATLLILFLLIVGPISAFVTVVVKQAIDVSNQAIPWVQNHLKNPSDLDLHDWLAVKFPFAQEFIPSQDKILESAGTVAQAVSKFLANSATKFSVGTAGFLLNFFIMIYAMFFFLKDGRQILEKIFYYMPLSHEDESRMLDRFVSVTRATIKGTILIGLIQGALGGLAFYVAGIDGAAFWGTIMVVLSIIPGVGAALVWVPAVIYLFIVGQTVPALLLAVWCALVVGSIDNFLRPILVGKDAEMPDLLILVGTLGGIFLFGAIGFIVGPIVCGLFLTAWDIYGTAFRDILPPVKDLRTGKVEIPVDNVGQPAAVSPAPPAPAPPRPKRNRRRR
jgi:predicted PurR-regulated permease PerM